MPSIDREKITRRKRREEEMKKKLFSIIMCALMVMCLMPSMAFADVVTDGWEVLSESPSGALKTEGNKIIITPSANNGAYTKTMRTNPIQDGTTTYDMIVDLSEDYTHGQLFSTSLGFGDAQCNYSTEFIVGTQRNGDKFILTAGVAPGESITLAPGVYTYRYTVVKTDSVVSSSFEVVETGDKLNFTNTTHLDNLKNSKYVRYLWAFGRDVNNTYTLDRDLVMYKTPVVAKVGSEAYATLASAIKAANTGSDKVVTLVASTSVDDLTIPTGVTLRTIGNAKLTVSGDLTVKGTLDLTNSAIASSSDSATPAKDRTLTIKQGGNFDIYGTVKSKSNSNDICQLGTMTIYAGGKYYANASTLYIGGKNDDNALAKVVSGKIVSTPITEGTYADGYKYVVSGGTTKTNGFPNIGKDELVVANGAVLDATGGMTLAGSSTKQLTVQDGGKLILPSDTTTAQTILDAAYGGEDDQKITSGTYSLDPSNVGTTPTSYLEEGYQAVENKDGTWTVEPKTLTSIAITVKEPEIGKTPDYDYTWTVKSTDSGEPYVDETRGMKTAWYKMAKAEYEDKENGHKWVEVKEGEKFQKDYYYLFVTFFAANDDYRLSDEPAVTFNGKKADLVEPEDGVVAVGKVYGPLTEKATTPATGDNSELGIFAVAGLISAVGVALVLRRKQSM